MSFSGKVAIVTGGGRDIGRAVTLALAGAGANVAFSYSGSEAQAMAKFDHPHVVPVHDYKEHLGTPYIQMPIYPACLSQRMAEYQADSRKAVDLMAKVASSFSGGRASSQSCA